MGHFEKGIFIFRRDLRLEDNTGLIRAARGCKSILPVFIFDPRQAKRQNNPYFGGPAFDFLLNALAALGKDIRKRGGKLLLLEGEAETEIPRLVRAVKADAVFFNADYTPFARKRDDAIKKACAETGAETIITDDLTLYPPGSVLTGEGHPYTVFTAFFRKCGQRPPSFPDSPPRLVFANVSVAELPLADSPPVPSKTRDTAQEARAILAAMPSFANYSEDRDYPAPGHTTGLSPHLKAGTVSPRQAWHACAAALGQDHPIIRALCWRDFFMHIAYHFPLVFGAPFREKFSGLKWEDSPSAIKMWKEGKTGFPIVDAGMRELNATGFMHNRIRMITATFLVKDLMVDWRTGEKYFAERLADYDPSVNNGNWQWCAGTGCDAQPFFRIFNPWLQARRFDPECEYIKRWVPELESVPTGDILAPGRIPPGIYPRPIVDHAAAAKRTLSVYRNTVR